MKNDQDFYDRFKSADYDILRLDDENEIEITLDAFARQKPPLQGPVLDIGCGTGRYVRALRARGIEVAGIDRSLTQIEASQESGLIQANCKSLPFESASFSSAIMILLLQQLEAHEREAALREARRVVAPNGAIYIKTRSHSDIRARMFPTAFPEAEEINIRRYPSDREMKHLLDMAGWNVVSLNEITHTRIMNSDDYLERVRKKHNSTLALLSQSAFQAGVSRLEALLINKRNIAIHLRHTLYCAVAGGRSDESACSS